MNPAFLTCALLLVVAPGSTLDGAHHEKVNDLLVGSSAEVKEAMSLLDQMEDEANRLHDSDWMLWIHWKQACGEGRRGHSSDAQTILEGAIKDAPNGYGYLPLMHLELGNMYLRSWKLKQAEDHSAKALDLAKGPPGQVFGKQFLIEENKVLSMRLLKAECLTFRGDNKAAMEEISSIDAQVRTKLEEFRNSGRPAPAAWKYMPIELGIQLSELDRRNSNVSKAVGRLKACLDELQSDESAGSMQMQFTCLLLLANGYMGIARFDDARDQLDRADQLTKDKTALTTRDLDIARANLAVEEAASTLDSRLEDPKVLARLDRATDCARKAVEDATKANPQPNVFTVTATYELAQALGMRGRVLDARGQGDEAKRTFDQAKKYCDDALEGVKSVYAPTHDFVLHMRRFRAGVNLQRGDVAAAKDEADDAFDLFCKERGKDHVDCGLFRDLLLEVADKAGNAKEAAAQAEAGQRLAIRRLPYLAGLTAPDQIKFFQDYDEPPLHDGLRLGIRYESLQDRSAEWLINGKAKIAEVMARVYQQGRGGKDALAVQEAVQRQAYLLYGPAGAYSDALLDQLESKKRDLAAKQALDPADRPGASALDRWIDMADIRKRLGPDEVYIDVCRLRAPERNSARAYYAWVVTAGGPARVQRLGEADEIDGLVKALQKHMENCAGSNGLFATVGPPDAESKLRRDCLGPLSKRLLDPLLPLAAGKKRWIVSPDGLLWNVPWAALIIPGTDRYAIEDESFRYVISGRDLLGPPPSAVKPGDPWIVADPDFNKAPAGLSGGFRPKSDPGYLGDLGGALEEGALVAQCLRPFFKDGPRVLTGGDATKARFLKLDPSPRILYLSTHGFFFLPTSLRKDDGLRVDPLLCCGVAFAGSNFLPDGKEDKDKVLPGWLTGAEVLAVDLSGTELVVLSACQSGTGEPHDGQSPADLRHAFQLAGARAVLSSLWSVDDEATRNLMVSFMKAYTRKPAADKADALREAQREMIKKLREGEDHHAHPFFWAAFTLSGY